MIKPKGQYDSPFSIQYDILEKLDNHVDTYSVDTASIVDELHSVKDSIDSIDIDDTNILNAIKDVRNSIDNKNIDIDDTNILNAIKDVRDSIDNKKIPVIEKTVYKYVEKPVKETVYKDRIVYRDRVIYKSADSQTGKKEIVIDNNDTYNGNRNRGNNGGCMCWAEKAKQYRSQDFWDNYAQKKTGGRVKTIQEYIAIYGKK